MSGKPPFGRLREATIFLCIILDQAPKAAEHPNLLPDDDLWNSIRCCWNTNPAGRPTMRAVLLEVRFFMEATFYNAPTEEGPVLSSYGGIFLAKNLVQVQDPVVRLTPRQV